MFGYAFNPLSVYFCYRRDETLAAILYEVRNTHKEKHTYVIPAAGTERAVVRQTCAKEMYVSPFIAMDAQYHFRIVPPGGRVNIVIREEDADGLLLAASFRGQARPFTGGALARILVRFPLMTLKIVAGIHWEACRLLLKGLPVFRHEPADEANRVPDRSSKAPIQAPGRSYRSEIPHWHGGSRCPAISDSLKDTWPATGIRRM